MRLIRRLTAIAALLIGALLPSAAGAATLYITEYANIGAINSNTTPWPSGPAITTQTVVVGGGSLQSSAFNTQTRAIQVICDTGCSISVGSNPTATTSTTLLQQGVYQNFVVAPGQKIAVIANTAGNTSGGTPSGTQDVNIVTCAVTAAGLCKAEDAVAGSADAGVASWGIQQTTPADTAADGDYVAAQIKDGAMWVQAAPSVRAAAGVTAVTTSAVASNLVVKNSPGNLYGLSVTTGGTAGFVFVSNTTTAPTAGGAAITPVKCYQIAANSTLGVTYNPPLVLSTGVTIVFSSTGCFTNTASATAFISGDAK